MRAWLFASLIVGSGACCAQESAAASRPWTIPPDGEIRQVIADRMRIQGAGMVIGVIEPAGRRIVAVGQSGSPDGRPLDGSTIFQIGSVTKVFTTLLLADMVVRGEVALDDPASKYLPRGGHMPERGRPITLRDLATHTSGLPSMPTNFALRGDPDPVTAYSPKLLDQFLSTYQLERAPGETWSYSNLGVALLGRLLAQQVGTDYEKLLRARIIEPLRLRSTAISLTRAQVARAAPGLDRYGELAAAWEMRTLPGSGSLRSSTNDLLQFLAAYLDTRETPLRRAIELQLSARSPVKPLQALGWGLGRFDDREIFVHDGGKAGFRSLVAFDPANRRGIVILVNARTDERLGVIALHLLTGKPLPPAREAAAPRERLMLGRRKLAAYEGQFRLETGRILNIGARHGHLIVETPGDGPSRFVAATERDFFDPSGEEEISFDAPTDGRSSAITLFERGKAMGKSTSGSRVEDRGRPVGTRRRADLRADPDRLIRRISH